MDEKIQKLAEVLEDRIQKRIMCFKFSTMVDDWSNIIVKYKINPTKIRYRELGYKELCSMLSHLGLNYTCKLIIDEFARDVVDISKCKKGICAS